MWVNPAQPPSVSRCAPRSRSPVSLIVLTRSCSCRWGPCPSPTPRLACPFYLFIYGRALTGISCNDIRAAWWPRCAARRWRAADRGADPAAAPSRAAGRGAASAPKRTRARGARPRQQKHQRLLLLLVSSRRGRARARGAPRSPRSLREGRDSNPEPPGAATARGGKTHGANLIEMLLLWHLLI